MGYYHPVLQRYEFYSSTDLILGVGTTKEIPSKAKAFGEKILLVSDKVLTEKTDIVKNVRKLLEEEGLSVQLFNEIDREPTIEIAERLAEFSRAGEFDVVVGVGGGSVLDMAKVASIAPANPGSMREYVGIGKVKNKGLPMILVPTTAGTGSEISKTTMVIIGDLKTWIISPPLYPDVAVVDPLNTLTMPPRVTAMTGMDALAHLIEGYMSTLSSPVTDAFSLEGTRLIFKSLRRAFYNGEDLEARFDMAVAASLGGYVLCGTPAVYGHSVSQTLARYGTPHGIACALALPYVMEYNVSAIPERLAWLAKFMGVDTSGMSMEEAARRAVNEVKRLVLDLKLPFTLQDLKVPHEDLDMLANELIEKYYRKNNPRKMTPEEARELYQKMWDGTVGDGGS